MRVRRRWTKRKPVAARLVSRRLDDEDDDRFPAELAAATEAKEQK